MKSSRRHKEKKEKKKKSKHKKRKDESSEEKKSKRKKSSSRSRTTRKSSVVVPKKLFEAIPDQYDTMEDLTAALRRSGLESSNVIIGVDYTKSNNWTGQKTFAGKSLHDLNDRQRNNPYFEVMSILGEALSPFDDDGLIPVFGFGDITTKDEGVFSFFPDRPCNGFEEVLYRYCEITPGVKLSGPTSFAPLIRESIDIVRETGEYHILVIIADGQVTKPQSTIDAIVEASNYPMSIIMVGVGDGPWDTMEEFDDELPERRFDNFQFVNFHEVLSKYDGSPTAFAVMALQEVPDQYSAIRKLNLL